MHITFKPYGATKRVGLLYVVKHLEMLPIVVTYEVREEVGCQILDDKITIAIEQSLRLAVDLKTYLITSSQ
jgi:CRISPR/Cas system-associated exonuclease Cas4 (RecB family)